MRFRTTSHGATLGAIFLTLAASTMTMTTAPAVASAAPAASTPTVPVLGHVSLKNNLETGGSPGVGTLHGVRRILGGTVIYFSVGYPSSTKDSVFIQGLNHRSPGYFRGQSSPWFGANMLVDGAGKKVYTGLIRSGDNQGDGKPDCICSGVKGVDPYNSGDANVVYQVVAALPDSVAFVDVFISGQVIGHVRVEDGPMTPEVDSSKPILVGMG